MHACNAITLDQLLSVRDGSLVDAATARHAEQCEVCASELARLRAAQAALQSLPQLQAPVYNAAAIRNRLRRDSAYRFVGVATAAGVAAVAILLAVMVGGNRDLTTIATTHPSDAVDRDIATEPEVQALVIRSQELEAFLQRLPRRPHVERASTSLTIDSLQDSIQWVDYQLLLADDVGITNRQAAQLWQDRVQLMDSLLKVRYAEAQRAEYFIPKSETYQ